jgi:hypothetical protein
MARKSPPLPPTYTHSDFQQIATAIGIEAEQVAGVGTQFDAAAMWFRLDKRRPRRTAPSKQREKLNQVANSPKSAVDGPGDRENFEALVLIGERDENPVLEATRRIGRLVEVLEGVSAAVDFNRRATKAAAEVAEVGKLTVREGHSGNDAVNDWVAAMMSVYRTITGKEPATSVGAPERSNEGIAGGPFIRFLQAAGKPLKLEFSENAWRSRARTILKGVSGEN